MEHLFLLNDLLESTVEAYAELLKLSYQQKDAITKNDVAQLSSVTEKQQSVLDGIRGLEADRKRLFADIQTSMDLPEGKLSLKDIVKIAQGELRVRLQGLEKKLEDTAAELRRISRLNKTLVDSQLQYTSLCINLIAGPEAPLGTYSGSGEVQEEPAAGRRLVDQAI